MDQTDLKKERGFVISGRQKHFAQHGSAVAVVFAFYFLLVLLVSFDNVLASSSERTNDATVASRHDGDKRDDNSARRINHGRRLGRGLRKHYHHGERYLCRPEAAQERSAPLQTLEDLKWHLVKNEEENVPFYMDATNVPDAQPYLYKGFVIRPIYIEGLAYKGRCTLVFAWLSTPMKDTSSQEEDTYLTPGTVLLHGGGGTAHKDWVEKWASNGFSSIAVALEGQTSHKDDHTFGGYDKSPYPGPYRHGSYSDWHEPLQDQWMFHAVTTSMLANTLLRSQPEVNADQVGVAGVSWGGVIATTVLPLDTRYAFAIIAYGSGSLTQPGWMEGHVGREIMAHDAPKTKEYYEQTWDPSPYLRDVKTPTLWISSPRDKNFSFKSQAATVAALHPLAPVWMVNIPDLLHGCYAMYMRKENYSFARTVVETASNEQTGGLVGIAGKHETENFLGMEGEHILGLYNATYRLLSPPTKATLVWTEDDEPSLHTKDFRRWNEVSVDIDSMNAYIGARSSLDDTPILFRVQQGPCDHRFDVSLKGRQYDSCLYSITVSLPPRTKYYYVNVELRNHLVVSSPYNNQERFDFAEMKR